MALESGPQAETGNRNVDRMNTQIDKAEEKLEAGLLKVEIEVSETESILDVAEQAMDELNAEIKATREALNTDPENTDLRIQLSKQLKQYENLEGLVLAYTDKVRKATEKAENRGERTGPTPTLTRIERIEGRISDAQENGNERRQRRLEIKLGEVEEQKAEAIDKQEARVAKGKAEEAAAARREAEADAFLENALDGLDDEGEDGAMAGLADDKESAILEETEALLLDEKPGAPEKRERTSMSPAERWDNIVEGLLFRDSNSVLRSLYKEKSMESKMFVGWKVMAIQFIAENFGTEEPKWAQKLMQPENKPERDALLFGVGLQLTETNGQISFKFDKKLISKKNLPPLKAINKLKKISGENWDDMMGILSSGEKGDMTVAELKVWVEKSEDHELHEEMTKVLEQMKDASDDTKVVDVLESGAWENSPTLDKSIDDEGEEIKDFDDSVLEEQYEALKEAFASGDPELIGPAVEAYNEAFAAALEGTRLGDQRGELFIGNTAYPIYALPEESQTKVKEYLDQVGTDRFGEGYPVIKEKFDFDGGLILGIATGGDGELVSETSLEDVRLIYQAMAEKAEQDGEAEIAALLRSVDLSAAEAVLAHQDPIEEDTETSMDLASEYDRDAIREATYAVQDAMDSGDPKAIEEAQAAYEALWQEQFGPNTYLEQGTQKSLQIKMLAEPIELMGLLDRDACDKYLKEIASETLGAEFYSKWENLYQNYDRGALIARIVSGDNETGMGFIPEKNIDLSKVKLEDVRALYARMAEMAEADHKRSLAEELRSASLDHSDQIAKHENPERYGPILDYPETLIDAENPGEIMVEVFKMEEFGLDVTPDTPMKDVWVAFGKMLDTYDFPDSPEFLEQILSEFMSDISSGEYNNDFIFGVLMEYEPDLLKEMLANKPDSEEKTLLLALLEEEHPNPDEEHYEAYITLFADDPNYQIPDHMNPETMTIQDFCSVDPDDENNRAILAYLATKSTDA
jgi:rubrerythrin